MTCMELLIYKEKIEGCPKIMSKTVDYKEKTHHNLHNMSEFRSMSHLPDNAWFENL